MTLPAGQSATRTRLARLAIGWVFLANGAALGSWVPHIPDAKHALGFTDGLLGLALLGMVVGSLVGLALSGVLTARFGSSKTTTTALVAILATPLPILAPRPGRSQSRFESWRCQVHWERHSGSSPERRLPGRIPVSTRKPRPIADMHLRIRGWFPAKP